MHQFTVVFVSSKRVIVFGGLIGALTSPTNTIEYYDLDSLESKWRQFLGLAQTLPNAFYGNMQIFGSNFGNVAKGECQLFSLQCI